MKKVILAVFCILFASMAQAGTKKVAASQFIVLSKSVLFDLPFELSADFLREPPQASLGTIKSRKSANIILQSTPGFFQPKSAAEMAETYCTLVPESFRPGKYKLRSLLNEDSPFSFEEMEGGRLKLWEGKEPVLVYNHAPQLAAGVPADRRRSTYIHPLYDLHGNSLTEDFPPDHFHHRGLSWMWQRVLVDDQEYDLWTIKGIHQHFEKWVRKTNGPVCALLGIQNSWKVGEKKVMEEIVWFRIFRKTGQGRAIDVYLALTAVEPVQILGEKDKGYGGLCLRFPARKETELSTPQGRENQDSNMKRFPWVDFSGIFPGSQSRSGIAVFQFSEHPDFPAGWTLRPKDEYGFAGIAWPGMDRAKLDRGKTLTLQYRLWIHDGDEVGGFVKQAFDGWIHPPLIHVE